MRRAIAIVLSDAERETLTTWARRRTAPARLVTRVRIVLAAAAGAANQQIAAELGLRRPLWWGRLTYRSYLPGVGPAWMPITRLPGWTGDVRWWSRGRSARSARRKLGQWRISV